MQGNQERPSASAVALPSAFQFEVAANRAKEEVFHSRTRRENSAVFGSGRATTCPCLGVRELRSRSCGSILKKNKPFTLPTKSGSRASALQSFRLQTQSLPAHSSTGSGGVWPRA